MLRQFLRRGMSGRAGAAAEPPPPSAPGLYVGPPDAVSHIRVMHDVPRDDESVLVRTIAVHLFERANRAPLTWVDAVFSCSLFCGADRTSSNVSGAHKQRPCITAFGARTTGASRPRSRRSCKVITRARCIAGCVALYCCLICIWLHCYCLRLVLTRVLLPSLSCGVTIEQISPLRALRSQRRTCRSSTSAS